MGVREEIGLLSSGLLIEEKTKVYENGLSCKVCSFTAAFLAAAASVSSCTAVGINNAEGCCVSDMVGTEYEKGGFKHIDRHTHTAASLIIVALCMPLHYLHVKLASHATSAPSHPKHISRHITHLLDVLGVLWSLFIIAL